MKSLARRAALAGTEFVSDHEFTYLTEVRYPDDETFRDGMIAVDERRRDVVPAQEGEPRAALKANAESRDGRLTLDQPIRLYLMMRT